jgi:peptidoglycan/xylan/chitin deacetylase (PgdA/CDA1 family)
MWPVTGMSPGWLGIAGASVLVASVDWFSKVRPFQWCGRIASRIDTREKAVALTFDDGPNPPYTERVLSTLAERGVLATFFLVGKQVVRFPDTVRHIVEAGHEIGNHSYSHRRLILRHPALIRKEIMLTDRALRRAGVTDEIPFRAPYCRKLFVLPYVLATMNKLHITFDTMPSPADYDGAPAEVVCDYVLRHARPGSIIVLHDGSFPAPSDRSNVVEATRLIIERMTADGYRFARVRELLSLDRAG